jgi:uncharacterized protein (DUF4415 family)
MKKTSSKTADDLRPEYDFDFKRMRPNPYAKRLKGKSVISIVLDEDVAGVFDSSEAVNDALRAIMRSTPRDRASAPSGKRRAS